MENKSVPESIKDAFSRQPGWLQLALVIAVIVLIYIAYNRLTKDIAKAKDKRLTNNEVKELQKQGKKHSFGYTQYKSFANTIYESFNNDGWGTDEDAIYAVYEKLKNDLDVLALEAAFGKREYVGDFFGGWVTWEEDQPLEVHLQRELEDEELDQINNILKRKGIKRRY